MGKILREFISNENKDFKFKIGNILASSLAGFVAGFIAALLALLIFVL